MNELSQTVIDLQESAANLQADYDAEVAANEKEKMRNAKKNATDKEARKRRRLSNAAKGKAKMAGKLGEVRAAIASKSSEMHAVLEASLRETKQRARALKQQVAKQSRLAVSRMRRMLSFKERLADADATIVEKDEENVHLQADFEESLGA